MTVVDRVHDLDGQGLTPQQIAVGVGASVARVLEILDDGPPPRVVPDVPPPAVFAAKERQTKRARWAAWRERRGIRG